MHLKWLKDHGVTSSYEDYLLLPWGVFEDTHLMVEYELRVQEMEAKRGHRR